jgi:hypothetical protein
MVTLQVLGGELDVVRASRRGRQAEQQQGGDDGDHYFNS